jgi:5-methylcytosine-specific restriction enzyme subunit McrC
MQRTPSNDAAGVGRLTIELNEWDSTGPTREPRLRDLSFQDHAEWRARAESLRGKIDIHERYDGITIETTSFVGRVDVGPLRIAVRPKLPAMPLTRLLRYAYGLRDLRLVDEALSPVHQDGIQDLLIALLASEVEELVHRGLARRYIATDERLPSPRGQILMERIIRDGGVVEAALPCRHYDRRTDWSVNRVLRAGLHEAARMTEDRELRRRVQKLSTLFGDVREMPRMGIETIDRVEQALTRVTEASRSALKLIRLLLDDNGVALEVSAGSSGTSGFLFDMNRFFERLVSQFLGEYVTGAKVRDQQSIRDMFVVTSRKTPSPRPDYALMRGKQLLGFYDAKYRDLWRSGLPPEWLYQLTIYALASPGRKSVLLYASMKPDARDEPILVRQPFASTGGDLGSVILRPVPLQELAALFAPGDDAERLAGRRMLADQLVRLVVQNQTRSMVA